MRKVNGYMTDGKLMKLTGGSVTEPRFLVPDGLLSGWPQRAACETAHSSMPLSATWRALFSTPVEPPPSTAVSVNQAAEARREGATARHHATHAVHAVAGARPSGGASDAPPESELRALFSAPVLPPRVGPADAVHDDGRGDQTSDAEMDASDDEQDSSDDDPQDDERDGGVPTPGVRIWDKEKLYPSGVTNWKDLCNLQAAIEHDCRCKHHCLQKVGGHIVIYELRRQFRRAAQDLGQGGMRDHLRGVMEPHFDRELGKFRNTFTVGETCSSVCVEAFAAAVGVSEGMYVKARADVSQSRPRHAGIQHDKTMREGELTIA